MNGRSNHQGLYSLPDLPDGTSKIEVEVQCFSTIDQEVTIRTECARREVGVKLPLVRYRALSKCTNCDHGTGPRSLFTGNAFSEKCFTCECVRQNAVQFRNRTCLTPQPDR
jgi:hypothetical protein